MLAKKAGDQRSMLLVKKCDFYSHSSFPFEYLYAHLTFDSFQAMTSISKPSDLFDQFYSKNYRDYCRRAAAMQTSGRVDTESLVQDAFFYLLSNLDPAEDSRWHGVLTEFIKQRGKDRFKKESRQSSFSELTNEDSEIEVIENVATTQPLPFEYLLTHEPVIMALAKLKEEDVDAHRILILLQESDMRYPQIAKALGISIVNARKKVSLARALLKSILNNL